MIKHVKGLDGIRAIAILLVVVHHSHFLTQDGSLYFASKIFGSGVDLFFIVSGYLITNILLNSKGSNSFLKSFYIRRALRIVPLYYAVLFVAFFIVPHLNLTGLEKFKNTLEWPYWLFLSNFYIASRGHFSNGLIDLSWSLSVEEQFYVFWSLCVYFLNEKKLQKIAIFILLFCPLLRFALSMLNVNDVAIHVMSFTRMDTLMYGSLLALVMRNRLIPSKVFYRIFAVSLPLLIAVFYLPLQYRMALGYSFLAMVFASVVGLVIKINIQSESKFETSLLKILEWKFLSLIGVYSYGIYLFHNPIQKALRGVCLRFFNDFQINIYSQQLFFYAFVSLISLILASISYNLYELQWLKLKKRID